MHGDDLLPSKGIFGADGGNMLCSAKTKYQVPAIDTGVVAT
jgi:hypothetical protein